MKKITKLLRVGVIIALLPSLSSAVSLPGLYGGSVQGAFSLDTWPTVTNIYMRPFPLSTAAQYTYFVYWGKIRLTAGTHSFHLGCDDWEYLEIDGTAVVPINAGGTYTFSAPETAYYDFELRAGNAAGDFGGSFKIDGTVNPADNGDGSLYLHEDGRDSQKACTIRQMGDPLTLGGVSPAYGAHEFPVGTVTNFYIPTGTNYVYVSDSWRISPTGYVHYAVTDDIVKSVIARGFAHTFDYEQTALTNGASSEIYWLWRNERRIKVTVDGHGTVSTLEAWGESTSPAQRLSAIPEPGYKFYAWCGDVKEADRGNPTIEVDFSKSRDIVCFFANENGLSYQNTWTGAAGDFRLDNPTNWFNECLPVENDTVVFSNTIPGVYTTARPLCMAALKLVGTGDVTFSLGGNTVSVDRVTQANSGLFTLTNGVFRNVYSRTLAKSVYNIGDSDAPRSRMLVTDATVDITNDGLEKYLNVHPSCSLAFTNSARFLHDSARIHFCVYSNGVASFSDSAVVGYFGSASKLHAQHGSLIFKNLTVPLAYFPTFDEASVASDILIANCSADNTPQYRRFFNGTGNSVTMSGCYWEWDHVAYWGNGTNCSFIVRDGAVLNVDSSFYCDINSAGHNNLLQIDDATVKFGRTSSTDSGKAKGITIRLGGANPILSCNLPLSSEYVYQFDVAETTNETWKSAPFQVKRSGISMTNSTLIVNARDLRRNGGGVVPLFKKETAGLWGNEINFKNLILPPDTTLLGGEGYNYLSVAVDGCRGTLFLLR